MKYKKEFNKWIETAPDWVKSVAQSKTVYQAMFLAFKAEKENKCPDCRCPDGHWVGCPTLDTIR